MQDCQGFVSSFILGSITLDMVDKFFLGNFNGDGRYMGDEVTHCTAEARVAFANQTDLSYRHNICLSLKDQT